MWGLLQGWDLRFCPGLREAGLEPKVWSGASSIHSSSWDLCLKYGPREDGFLTERRWFLPSSICIKMKIITCAHKSILDSFTLEFIWLHYFCGLENVNIHRWTRKFYYLSKAFKKYWIAFYKSKKKNTQSVTTDDPEHFIVRMPSLAASAEEDVPN